MNLGFVSAGETVEYFAGLNRSRIVVLDIETRQSMHVRVTYNCGAFA
jgi:hypothetical protein